MRELRLPDFSSNQPRLKMAFPPIFGILRVISVFLWMCVSALLGLLLCIVRFQDPDIPAIITRYIYSPISLWLANIRVIHEGWENIPEGKSAVYIGNHQSLLDLSIFGARTPRRCVCVAKTELWLIPVLNIFWWASGCIFIKRKDRKSAVDVLSAAIEPLKKNEKSVWIFTEGTRNKNRPNELLPFKKGAFHMAVAAQVPIVPVVCSNQFDIWNPSKNIWTGGTVILRALEPIDTTGKTTADIDDLLALSYERMDKALKEISAKTAKLNGVTQEKSMKAKKSD